MSHSGTTSHLATRVGLNRDAKTTAVAIPTTTIILPTVTWNGILNQVYGTSEVRWEKKPMRFYLNERLFLDLTTIESRAALWTFENVTPQISALHKIHLLVRSDFFIQGSLADKIFSPAGKSAWFRKRHMNQTQNWRPRIAHTLFSDHVKDNHSPRARLVTFKIQVVDDGNGLQISAPCALEASQARGLTAYASKLAQSHKRPLNGHDLIRFAAHLADPMFAHPDQWHKTRGRRMGKGGYVTDTCPAAKSQYDHSDCRECRTRVAWEFEAEEDDLEVSNGWLVESKGPMENEEGKTIWSHDKVNTKKRVRVKDDCSRVIVYVKRATEAVGNREGWKDL